MPKESCPFPTYINPDNLMEEDWESGNIGHGDERFGNRPDGKWKGKIHTLKVILNKLHLSLKYAPQETNHFLTDLIVFRLKEIILRK